jgi:uncharacterized integral membrane protein
VKWVKTLFWLVIILFAILFSIQNQDKVTLRFGLYLVENYSWETLQAPLFLVILFSIFLGVLVQGIGDLYRRFLHKKTLRQHQKTIERLEKEIQSLRSSRQDQAFSRNKDL